MRIGWGAPGLVVALVSVACQPGDLPSDLGEHPSDLEDLRDAFALRHLAEAREGSGAMTVEELFRKRPGYVAAPDPTGMFQAMQDEHEAAPPVDNPRGLRVLTFNTALLDRWYPFAVVRSPRVDVRRKLAPEVLLGSDDWDVVLLQEVWDWRDVDAFQRRADETGYLLYAGSSGGHEEHGLVILVREAIVDAGAPDDRDEHVYELQRDIEKFPGPGVARGFLSWRFRHAPSGRNLVLLNTHATAFPGYAHVRDAQARELGLAARDALPGDLVLVGGDLNGAPYYPQDRFGKVDGEWVRDWWRNAQAYALLLHYGELQDVQVVSGRAQDVAHGDQLGDYDGSFKKEPLGGADRCVALAGTFTATDCNTLYFDQYAGTEYPARIDHLLVRGGWEDVRVLDSWLEHTEALAGEDFELSDHYGVAATLVLPGG